jgi:hypothetical protein
MCRKHLFDRAKWAAMKFFRDCFGTIQIAVNYAHEPHRFAAPSQFVIHTGVIAPEGAHADHSNRNEGSAFQVPLSLL